MSAAAEAVRCGWKASKDDGWGLKVHEVSLEVQLSNAQTDERGNACVGKVESRSGGFNFLGGATHDKCDDKTLIKNGGKVQSIEMRSLFTRKKMMRVQCLSILIHY